MKKKFFTTLSLLLLLVISFWACQKEDLINSYQPIDYTVLPPATQEGKNTFGCNVNQEPWVPRVELFLALPRFDKTATLYESNGKGHGVINCNIISKTRMNLCLLILDRRSLNRLLVMGGT